MSAEYKVSIGSIVKTKYDGYMNGNSVYSSSKFISKGALLRVMDQLSLEGPGKLLMCETLDGLYQGMFSNLGLRPPAPLELLALQAEDLDNEST